MCVSAFINGVFFMKIVLKMKNSQIMARTYYTLFIYFIRVE